MLDFSSIITLAASICGIASFFVTLYQIFCKPSDTSLKGSINFHIKTEYTLNYYDGKHSGQSMHRALRVSFWDKYLNDDPKILILIFAIGAIMYFEFLTILRILLSIIILCGAALSVYIFMKIKVHFIKPLKQSIYFGCLMTFYIISAVAVANTDTGITFTNLFQDGENAIRAFAAATSYIFMICLSLKPIIHAFQNRRKDALLWLNFKIYAFFPLCTFFTYKSADNTFYDMIGDLLDMISQLGTYI